MSALVTVGFCAASSGATLGFLLGSMMASGKLRDLELAYGKLSDAARLFLQAHLQGTACLLPVAREDLLELKERLQAADVLAGLRLACDARYAGTRKRETPAT